MTERERLVEILINGFYDALSQIKGEDKDKKTCDFLADFLLENNVFVAPVTEGDSIYIILLDRVLPFDVISVSLFRKTLIFKAQHGLNLTWVFKMEDFGKTVFLTREEAEKALKEREENA